MLWLYLHLFRKKSKTAIIQETAFWAAILDNKYVFLYSQREWLSAGTGAEYFLHKTNTIHVSIKTDGFITNTTDRWHKKYKMFKMCYSTANKTLSSLMLMFAHHCSCLTFNTLFWGNSVLMVLSQLRTNISLVLPMQCLYRPNFKWIF